MVLNICLLVISLILLLLAAEKLVGTSVDLARRLNVSTMVIGLTVVAIGTSLPEVAASAAAAYRGHPEIALGNVLGSNICNIGLIFGLPALFAPICCRRRVMRREGVLMLGCTFLLWGVAILVGEFTRTIGIVFLALFIAFVSWVFNSNRHSILSEIVDDPAVATDRSIIGESQGPALSRTISTAGLCLVVVALSSELLVRATVGISRGLGISENVIALSVIAFGTSVPELSVSFAAARRKETEILVGNILGSNISNILLVLGAASVIMPIGINPLVVQIDFVLTTVFALLGFAFLFGRKGITRPRGALLLLLYVGVLVRCVVYPTI